MFIRSMLKDKPFWKTLLALALPIAFQNLLSSSLAIVDNIMIGQLGDIAVGAVGEAAQVAFLINIFLFGLTSGGAVFAAQYWGNRNTEGIKRTYGLVLLSCTLLATVAAVLVSQFPHVVLGWYTNSQAIIALGSEYLRIAAFSYIGIAINLSFCTILRSTEKVTLPVVANLISVFVNVVFNALLIFGLCGFPQLGVKGAAIATVIAAFVNPLVIFAVSFFSRGILRSSLREMFRFPAGFVKHFFQISLPVFVNEALWALGVAGVNMVFGRMGESNIAALTIARTVENLAFVLIVGLCNASGVLIGKHIGHGDFDTAKLYARRFTLIVPCACAVIGAVIIALRAPILSLFALSAEATATAMGLLFLYGLEMPLRNLPYVTIVGIFRAGGDTRTGLLFDMPCLWGIALPITIVLGLVLKWEFLTVYLLMLLCEDIPKSILCVRHVLSDKWLRVVT